MTDADILKKPLIYLAGPYSHKELSVQEERASEHCKAASFLRKKGTCVYSPIAETHNIAKHCDLGGTWEDWRTHDIRLLSACTDMYILTIPGWIQSRGVRGEVKFCLLNNVPITMLSPEGELIKTDKETLLEQLGVHFIHELND